MALKVKFQLAELLILGATLLFLNGYSTYGWVFFASGLFVAFGRYAMDYQQRIMLKEELDKSVDSLKDSVPEVLNAFVTGLAKASNKNKMH